MKDIKNVIINKINSKNVVSLTRELIKIPSHRDIPEQERRIAEYIANRFEKSGIDAHLREVAEDRPNVIAKIGGSRDGCSLMLNGHIDTVPIYGWTTNGPMAHKPYSAKIKNRKIYGRGSCDMKGGIASMIVAMEAIKNSNLDLNGDLIFTGVVGEEGSCSIGTKDIIRNGPRADYVVIGEATQLNIAIANRGSWDFLITIKGRTAHSGEPEKGINAIVKATRIINALEDQLKPMLEIKGHRLLGHSVMNVSKIEGGTYGDVVPDHCEISVRIRYNTYYTRRQLEQIVNEVVFKLKKEDPEIDVSIATQIKSCSSKYGEVTLEGLPAEISQNSLVVEKFNQSIKEVTGTFPKIVGFKGWTDAALFVNDGGIPAINFGPGNGGAHSPLEYLEVNQLRRATQIFALAALNICNVDRKVVGLEK